MANEKKGQTEETPETKDQSKGKKKLLIILIAAVIIVAAGATASYFLILNKPSSPTETKSKEIQGINFAFEPFVVNLMDQGGNKYLKVSIQLELANAKFAEVAKNKTPQLRDAIITLLTNKTSEELITPEGKILLKDEIKNRANQILGEGSVLNVYLTDFVMQ
ncbi:MAG: flagellar basal body-associated FliL family protein [Thermodesulfovibrionaceae bacterium]